MTIYIPPEDISKKNHIITSADKAHYLLTVMRCKSGDVITVIDGRGKFYKSKIQNIRNGSVVIDILEQISIDTESPFNLILCQSIIKGDKMDLVIQKSTELGIKMVIPLITERVIVRDTRKLKRWQKIAEEASEQCGRAVIPMVSEPVKIEQFLSSQGKSGLIFWEEGGKTLSNAFRELIPTEESRFAFKQENKPFYILIGPEGGLTAGEVKMAEDNGFIKTTLGKRLLKSETASIVATALIQFLLENEELTSII